MSILPPDLRRVYAEAGFDPDEAEANIAAHIAELANEHATLRVEAMRRASNTEPNVLEGEYTIR